MDKSVLFGLSSGLYVVGTKGGGGRFAGCVVNTVTQSTSNPVTITVCINKENYTNECLKKTGEFAVTILSEKTKPGTFGVFGFQTGRTKDKFAEVSFALTPSGQPFVNEGSAGWLQCKVMNSIDIFTHTIFTAEVTETGKLAVENPMTYAYYHNVIKGKTPKNASSYAGEEAAEKYVCGICGYEYPGSKEEFESLPADYVCPICGVNKSEFKYQKQL